MQNPDAKMAGSMQCKIWLWYRHVRMHLLAVQAGSTATPGAVVHAIQAMPNTQNAVESHIHLQHFRIWALQGPKTLLEFTAHPAKICYRTDLMDAGPNPTTCFTILLIGKDTTSVPLTHCRVQNPPLLSDMLPDIATLDHDEL